jgi:ribosomal protein L19
MEENIRTIEINGVKFEVDLRHAKKIENFKIGDKVKILKKEYSDNYTSYHGVIVGFDNFESLPTIIIVYLKQDYSGVDLQFAYINSKSKDIEVCADANDVSIELDKAEVVGKLNKEIEKKQSEIEDIERKKSYFLAKFGMFFPNKKG